MRRRSAQRRDEPCKTTTLQFPASFHRALKMEAAQRGTTMSALVISAIEERMMLVRPRPVTVAADEPSVPGA